MRLWAHEVYSEELPDQERKAQPPMSDVRSEVLCLDAIRHPNSQGLTDGSGVVILLNHANRGTDLSRQIPA